MVDDQSGEILLVDKPFKWTSFDVVNKLRWNLKQKLGVKNIKVGHAGTLDPLATGLLIICTGKNTKKIDHYVSEEKRYTGTILLGKTTPSYDLETEFNASFSIDHISTELMEEARLSFLGEIDQVPPLFSAKQIDGKRAYELARAGSTIELNPNKVTIYSFEINSSNFPEINFEITCSKGTYIRSIAHDFGKKIDSGATLISLRRTGSGVFDIEQARSVDDWIQEIHNV